MKLCCHCNMDPDDPNPPSHGVRIVMVLEDVKAEGDVHTYKTWHRWNPEPPSPDKIPTTAAVLVFQHVQKIIRLVNGGAQAVKDKASKIRTGLTLPTALLNPHSDDYKRLVKRGKK